MTDLLELPGAIDLLSATIAEALVCDELERLEQLRAAARDAAAQAEQLEAQLAADRIDPAVSHWMAGRLRAAIERMRSEGESDAAVVVAMAHREARRIRAGGRGSATTFPRVPVLRTAPVPPTVAVAAAAAVPCALPAPGAPVSWPAAAGPLPLAAAAPGLVEPASTPDPDDSWFWDDDAPPRWWRRRPATASVLQAAAGLAAALALLVRFW